MSFDAFAGIRTRRLATGPRPGLPENDISLRRAADTAADYAHHDLNLSNVLTDGVRITGVVDWDEFGLGRRGLDLIALAVDCEQRGDRATADRLLARAAQVAGDDGLRCLVSYRIIGAGSPFTPTTGRPDSFSPTNCGIRSSVSDSGDILDS